MMQITTQWKPSDVLRMAVVGKMLRMPNIVGQYRSILLNR
jgi:hypothetical protein